MSTPVAELLPSNSTSYERAIAAVLDTRERLITDLRRVPAVGITDIPDDWVPWLILHYSLESIYPVVGDGRKTLTEGRRWQRVRGTNAATERYVLPWLGLAGQEIADRAGRTGPIEEERIDDLHADWYQLALASPLFDRTVMELLLRGDRLSKDAGSQLARIYSGYDIRPMRFDQTRLDGALLDDWSGVYVEPFEPKLSFGLFKGGRIEFGVSILALRTSERSGVARFEEGFILDRSKLDLEMIEPTVVRIESAIMSDTISLVDKARMPWPRTPWPGTSFGQLESSAVYGGLDGTLGQ